MSPYTYGLLGVLLTLTNQVKASYIYSGSPSEAIDQSHLIFIGEVERLQSPSPSQRINNAFTCAKFRIEETRKYALYYCE